MADTGWLSPAEAFSYSGTWVNANNIKVADGNSTTCVESNGWAGLKVRSFGAAIPIDKVIVGIEVEITGAIIVAASDYDGFWISNYTGSSGSSTYNSDTIVLTHGSTPSTVVFGSPTTTFGLSLTPAQVNSDLFGGEFEHSDTGFSVAWDSVRIKVYYEDGPPTDDTGWLSPSNVYSYNGSWTGVNNVKAVDGNFAVASNVGTWSGIHANSFGANVPLNREIVRVELELIGSINPAASGVDAAWINNADANNPPYLWSDIIPLTNDTTQSTVVYGDPGSLALTPALVNANTFGVSLEHGTSGSGSWDSFRLKVYYTKAEPMPAVNALFWAFP